MAQDKPKKKDLPAVDYARMERILDSDPEAISEADKNFIFARRDYLTTDEKKQVGITAAAVKKWSEANGADEDEDDDEDEE